MHNIKRSFLLACAALPIICISMTSSAALSNANRYVIGDKGPAGGIVFKINRNGNSGLEVARDDEPGTYTWSNGLAAARTRGNDWRMPSKTEWDVLLKNKKRIKLDNLATTRYWSSTRSVDKSPLAVSADHHAWIRNHQPDRVLSVRAVRPFSTSPCQAPDYSACTPGDKGPAGGIIFYISPDKRRLLEVADNDITQGASHEFSWGCHETSTTGLLDELFTGKSNAQRIVELCTSQVTAASLTTAYVQNGYNDYFLPSRDELSALYGYRKAVRGLTKQDYWSSSQDADGNPLAVSFRNHGKITSGVAGQRAGIRPVRAFASSTQTLTPVIHDYLRRIAPNAEGVCFEMQTGSRVEYLPTPGDEYWGKPDKVDAPANKLLDAIYSVTAGAQKTISLAGMSALPSSGFLDALIKGLSDSYAEAIRRGSDLPKLKILYGSPISNGNAAMPVLREPQLQQWLDTLTSGVSKSLSMRNISLLPDQMPILLAASTTSMTEFAWNHSKIAIADNHDLLWGGVNWWPVYYLQPGIEGSPTVDLNARLKGKVASTATDFLDYQWRQLLDKGANTENSYIDLVTTASGPKSRDLSGYLSWWDFPEPETRSPSESDQQYLSLAGLGYGVASQDFIRNSLPISPLQTITGEDNSPGDPAPQMYYDDASTHIPIPGLPGQFVPDIPNQREDFAALNPHRPAFVKLASLAKNSIMLYQQDVWGTLFDKYDIRLMQTLAKALDNDIKVRIIVTSPGPDAWANNSEVTPLINVLNRMVADRRNITLAQATEVLKRNLQYGTMSIGNNVPGRAHPKLLMVDDQAFYVGSANAYPFTQAEYGVLIENQMAVDDLKEQFVDPGWNNAIKLWDYRTGVYNLKLDE